MAQFSRIVVRKRTGFFLLCLVISANIIATHAAEKSSSFNKVNKTKLTKSAINQSKITKDTSLNDNKNELSKTVDAKSANKLIEENIQNAQKTSILKKFVTVIFFPFIKFWEFLCWLGRMIRGRQGGGEAKQTEKNAKITADSHKKTPEKKDDEKKEEEEKKNVPKVEEQVVTEEKIVKTEAVTDEVPKVEEQVVTEEKIVKTEAVTDENKAILSKEKEDKEKEDKEEGKEEKKDVEEEEEGEEEEGEEIEKEEKDISDKDKEEKEKEKEIKKTEEESKNVPSSVFKKMLSPLLLLSKSAEVPLQLMNKLVYLPLTRIPTLAKNDKNVAASLVGMIGGLITPLILTNYPTFPAYTFIIPIVLGALSFAYCVSSYLYAYNENTKMRATLAGGIAAGMYLTAILFASTYIFGGDFLDAKKLLNSDATVKDILPSSSSTDNRDTSSSSSSSSVDGEIEGEAATAQDNDNLTKERKTYVSALGDMSKTAVNKLSQTYANMLNLASSFFKSAKPPAVENTSSETENGGNAAEGDLNTTEEFADITGGEEVVENTPIGAPIGDTANTQNSETSQNTADTPPKMHLKYLLWKYLKN